MQFVIALIILILLLIGYFIFENKNLSVTDYLLEQPDVPKQFQNMRFVCITDLHQNQFGKNNEKLLKAIDGCKPDAVLIAGDLIIARTVEKSYIALDFIRELAKKYPVYYAPGNHELKWFSLANNEGYHKYVSEITKCGVIYLDNDEIVIKKGKDSLQIVGLNLSLDYYNKASKAKELTMDELEQFIGSSDPNSYTILLAHVPDYFEQYVKWGADFILSGHNHGGILRLWKLGGVISPRYHLFPKYDAGIYKEGKSVMFLSRGLGTHTIPVRMFNRPELICVQIKKK